MKLENLVVFIRDVEKYNDVIDLFTKDGKEIPSYFVDTAMKADVIKFEKVIDRYKVYVDMSIADISDEDTKFYWPVCQAAEGYSTGYVKLTRKEAEIVAFASDQDNWECVEYDAYCGSFSIDLDRPITVEDFKKGVR